MDKIRWARHALVNRLQTLILLLFISSYSALLGYLLWGREGVLWLLLVGIMFVLLSPTASTPLVMRLYRGQPLSREEVPELYQSLVELSRRAGLMTVPRIYYVPSSMVNAFAVGTRQRAGIAMTNGLLKYLNRRELVAVLAHEVSHIRNNDIRVMSLADMASRLTSALATVGQVFLLINLPLIVFSGLKINWSAVLVLLFAPQLSVLAQLGLSRVREYDADLNAAYLTGDPEGLAQALIKLEKRQGSYWSQFLTPGYRIPAPSLLRTHPPTEERVRRLRELQQDVPNGTFYEISNSGQAHLSRDDLSKAESPRWHFNGLWY